MFPPLHKGGVTSGTGSGGPPTTLVPKGKVFKKEPIKVLCERGRTYKWCSCGVSAKQVCITVLHMYHYFLNCNTLKFTCAVNLL